MDIGKKAARRLGKRIASIRKQKGWTQQELAAEIGVEQAYISKIESGILVPSFPRVVRIAHAMGMKLSDLCVGID